MSFVYPLLLGGLLLAGIPILIHLIMQQKPKRLPFPAFRFLLQKQRTNQRKLRLRHLLLLLLRIGLIALLCLALARPRLFSERLNLGSDRPAAVALLFDTSMSMEYTVGGKTRLDEARRRALELLDELPEGSQVAVLDSADLGGEWQPNLGRAREAINALRLRPGNSPVTRQLTQAGRLFASVSHDEQSGPPPWFLYVFTDRTLESWDESEVRSAALPEGLNTVLVDVGVENPANVAIANLELPRTTLGPEDRLEARVTFQATGQDCDTFAIFQINGETPGEKRPVQLKAGESVVVSFERSLTTLQPGPHRLEVKLGTNDSLPFDNVRFAAFEVRGGRKVLAIADDPASAQIWKLALESTGGFRCDVERTDRVGGLDIKKLLAEYRVVCLVNVSAPDPRLWAILEEYVRKGGGLILVPGPELTHAAWHDDASAQRLLPAQWQQVVQAKGKEGAAWSEVGGKHPLLAPFQTWRRTADVDFLKPEFLPRAIRYWIVTPVGGDGVEPGKVVVDYAGEGQPAIVERAAGLGRVLQLTTGFDGRKVNDKPWWNNYLESTFYLVFVNLSVGYLAGDAEVRMLNWTAGQTPLVPVPVSPRFPIYLLDGPGLVGSDVTVNRAEEQNEVRVPQAVTPGNYVLTDGAGTVAARFSVNVKAEECQLARVPIERIEEVIGSGAVMSVDQRTNLNTAVQGRYKQPIELLPWLMLLLLFVFAVENLLANRFYRRNDVNAATQQPASGEG